MQARRYGQLAGNVGQAVAAFAVAYLILQHASVGEYGVLTFILLLQAFGIAVVHALVGAPLLILLNADPSDAAPTADETRPGDAALILGFVGIALLVALALGLLQFGIVSWALHAPLLGLLLGSGSALQILRFALRSYWLHRQALKVIQSDLLQTVSVLLPLGLMLLSQSITLWNIALLLLVAGVIANLPLVSLFRHWLTATPNWLQVRSGIQQQGKPALFGVITVEFTANFHSYLVMLTSGSQAFAAIAAATLYFRPQAVILQSLQQSEKTQLVRAWCSKQTQHIRQILRTMQYFALAAFLLNGGGLLVVYYLNPQWLWPDSATQHDFLLALTLWSLIALLRGLRLGSSTLLQAADQFRSLAQATYVSAAITVPAAWLCWWLGGAVVSLVGVLLGEIVLAALLQQRQRSLVC